MTIQTPASCFCDRFLNIYGDHNAKIRKIYFYKTAFRILADQIRSDVVSFFGLHIGSCANTTTIKLPHEGAKNIWHSPRQETALYTSCYTAKEAKCSSSNQVKDQISIAFVPAKKIQILQLSPWILTRIMPYLLIVPLLLVPA